LIAVTVIALVVFPVFVHEFGHYVGGALCGSKLVLFQVGPFILRKQDGQVTYEFKKSAPLGGLCVMRDGTGDFSLRAFRWSILGGPIASIALASVAVALAARLGVGQLFDGSPDSIARTLALFTAITSWMILPYTLIPMNYKGFPTDMKQYMITAKGGPDADRFASIMSLSSDLRTGVSAKDLNEVQLARTIVLRDGTYYELLGNVFAYYRARQREEFADAARFIERAFEIAPLMSDLFSDLKIQVLYERVFFLAKHEGKTDEAVNLMKSPEAPPELLRSVWARAIAAIKAAEGNKSEAIHWIDKAIDAAQVTSQKMKIPMKDEIEWLHSWKAELEASSAESVPN